MNDIVLKHYQNKRDQLADRLKKEWIDSFTSKNLLPGEQVHNTAKVVFDCLSTIYPSMIDDGMCFIDTDSKGNFVLYKFLYNFNNLIGLSALVGLLGRYSRSKNDLYFNIGDLIGSQEFFGSHIKQYSGKDGNVAYYGCRYRLTVAVYSLTKIEREFNPLEEKLASIGVLFDPFCDFKNGIRFGGKGQCGDFYEFVDPDHVIEARLVTPSDEKISNELLKIQKHIEQKSKDSIETLKKITRT